MRGLARQFDELVAWQPGGASGGSLEGSTLRTLQDLVHDRSSPSATGQADRGAAHQPSGQSPIGTSDWRKMVAREGLG